MRDRSAADGSSTRRRLLGAVGVGLGTTLAGCSGVVDVDRRTETERRSVDPSTVSTLAVTEATGDIDFRAESRDDIAIVARKRALGRVSFDELGATVRTVGDRLEVTTDEPRVVGFGGGRVDLEIRAPPSVAVDEVRTADGDVRAESVPDGATLGTTDGDVSVTDARGDVRAESRDGDVLVDGTDGTLSATTVDGEIRARDPARVDALRTRDGDVVADVPAAASDAVVASTDGDLLLRLGDDLSATLTARTDDGEFVVTDGGGAVSVRERTESRLRAAVNGGDAAVTARTRDGDITIRA
ncbi:DUF4097 family beta strand repeat-containing protein [Halorubrum ezzemoulense]|uniref:DUF4097 family beta strand repeat-containing protein n=1 Tax=Halorubrum ezzemoulense TaxID=337243 RepID=UPI00232F4BDD|nr:DUF4097 family beta strand repeat-containing protein [Halorubrum ezzemoulense]MDB9232503.1 DUF4097 family beta strand repeat-containing protein [Halorubrum ezzemoulense]